MADNQDIVSLWEESDAGEEHQVESILDKVGRIPTVESLTVKYDKINQIIRELSEAGQESLEQVVDRECMPKGLSLASDAATAKAADVTASIREAKNREATNAWTQALPVIKDGIPGPSFNPRVIQSPEWIAVLNLMAVQLPELSKIADDLELIGQGYYYSSTDRALTEMAGDWLSENVGPVDVQIMKTRVSSLKGKVGARTVVKGKEAIEVCPFLPVRYFNSYVVSVMKDDIETIALKILASSPDTPPWAAVEIGRGRNPYHIRDIGGVWSKISTAIAVLRSKTRPWVT
jgi:hypothetical protein